MDIEKAKQLLHRIDIRYFLSGITEQSNYIVDKANECNIAIETILNELDKKDKIINEMAQELIDVPIRMVKDDLFKFTNIPDTLNYFTKKAEGK